MSNTTYINVFLRNRGQTVVQAVNIFKDRPTLENKLMFLASKMYQETVDNPSGVPRRIIEENEILLRFIANHHAHELDDGYTSVCDFVSDLMAFYQDEEEIDDNRQVYLVVK